MPFADLDTALRRRAADDTFSGVVLLRRASETLFSFAGGLASRRWSVPMSMDMRFDVASVTKLFTSVAALRLVDRGLLGLADRITDHVDLAGSAISSEVTIRQLLSHTSGIADDADEEAGEDYADLFRTVPCYSVLEIRDSLPFFVDKPAEFPPGQGCRYCNAGYQLVGLAIEAITGRGFREVVADDVFAVAGMSRSGFFWRHDATPDVAEGWDVTPTTDDPPGTEARPGRNAGASGWTQNIFSYPPVGDAAGGAHVTAADLVAFIQAVRAGILLQPPTAELFLTPQVKHHDKDDRQIWYGLGLGFDLGPDGVVASYYKDGINAGASAIIRYYPAAGIDVAVLSNAEGGAWPVIDDVHDAIRARHPEVGDSGF